MRNTRTGTAGFFATNEARRTNQEELPELLDSLLDAVLHAEKEIAESFLKDIAERGQLVLLTYSGIKTIIGSNRIQTGTALQMAFYSRNEEIAKMIADNLDPNTLRSQCVAVFGEDYYAFSNKQKQDAITLFRELQYTFNDKRPISELETVKNDFIIRIQQYAKDNPVHNLYILQCLTDFYFGSGTETYPFNNDCSPAKKMNNDNSEKMNDDNREINWDDNNDVPSDEDPFQDQSGNERSALLYCLIETLSQDFSPACLHQRLKNMGWVKYKEIVSEKDKALLEIIGRAYYYERSMETLPQDDLLKPNGTSFKMRNGI